MPLPGFILYENWFSVWKITTVAIAPPRRMSTSFVPFTGPVSHGMAFGVSSQAPTNSATASQMASQPARLGVPLAVRS